MEIKNKISAITNKIIQKKLLDSNKVQKDHNFQLKDII
jgi:hypothetical protein